jgi:glycosyltransferase involved in cell wall biosynthesis
VQIAYYRDGIRRALREAHKLIAISNATADRIRQHIQDPERLHVIHHGVHPRFAPCTNGAARERTLVTLDLPTRFFLVVGQAAPYKNHHAVRDAFLAANLPPDVGLVMIQRLNRHHRSLRSRGVAGRRLRVLPAVSEHQLLALYRSTLALVHFSRCEGFGLPALEAAACGAPVIASRIPASREILENAPLYAHSTAQLTRALERVARDPGLRRDMSAKGIARAAAFSWQRSANAHLEVYRAAARGG